MHDSNPGALLTDVAEQLNRFGLASLHIVEPRVKVVAKESSDVIAILLTCESTVRRLGVPLLSLRDIVLAILRRGPLCREASIQNQ